MASKKKEQNALKEKKGREKEKSKCSNYEPAMTPKRD